MNRRSAVIVAAGLVAALMAGTVSRGLTVHSAAPIVITVQTPTAPTSAAARFETESTRG